MDIIKLHSVITVEIRETQENRCLVILNFLDKRPFGSLIRVQLMVLVFNQLFHKVSQIVFDFLEAFFEVKVLNGIDFVRSCSTKMSVDWVRL